jgi:release factor glutamine methyltransferase
MNNVSLQLQARKIDEYRRRKKSFENELSGVTFTVLPNVFPGGADSEVLSESITLREGDSVLDLCTGNGIVALYASLHGAAEVIGTDLNPAAIKNAALNARQLNLHNTKFIETDLFPKTSGTYDIITINPPYTDHPSPDKTAICFWDEGNKVIKSFFREFRRYLKPGGTAYIAWSDFASQELLPYIAEKNNCKFELIGTKAGRSGFNYYAYRIIAL